MGRQLDLGLFLDDGAYSNLPFHTDVCHETKGPYSTRVKKGIVYCISCSKAIGTPLR